MNLILWIVCSTLIVCLPAHSQSRKVEPSELPIILNAYVDGVVEWRQFLIACAERDPANWIRGGALIMFTMRAAGMDENAVAALNMKLLSGAEEPTPYDCDGDVAKRRLAIAPPADWVSYHTAALTGLGIEIVTQPPQGQVRLMLIRSIFMRQLPIRTKILNCSAAVKPGLFPSSYQAWNDALDKVASMLRDAGYGDRVLTSIVDHSRSLNLMRPIADRLAFVAGCLADSTWGAAEATQTESIVSEVSSVLKNVPAAP